MNRKLLRKSVHAFSKAIAKAHGFDLYKSTTLIKKRNSILQVISFDLPPSGLQCNIAIIPTYVPTNVIFYDIGNRLNHFKTILSGNWSDGDTEHEIASDLMIVQDLIEANVMPWFDEISSPKAFIEMLESELSDETKRVTMCPPHLIYLYIGFSYLFIKEYSKAESALKIAERNTLEYASNFISNSPWCLVQPNIQLLEKGRFELIDKNITNYTMETYTNLGLK